MPSSLISSFVMCTGSLMNAKLLNFPVLLFIRKSILHVSRKYGVDFKPKISQISCLMISSSKLPTYTFYCNISLESLDLWDAIFLAVLKNKAVQLVVVAILLQLIALCCENFC